MGTAVSLLPSHVEFLQQMARQVTDEICAELAARDDRPLLRIPDLAARLNVSDRTARNMVDRGDIASFVIGKDIRVVAPAVVDEYVRARQASEGEE